MQAGTGAVDGGIKEFCTRGLFIRLDPDSNARDVSGEIDVDDAVQIRLDADTVTSSTTRTATNQARSGSKAHGGNRIEVFRTSSTDASVATNQIDGSLVSMAFWPLGGSSFVAGNFCRSATGTPSCIMRFCLESPRLAMHGCCTS